MASSHEAAVRVATGYPPIMNRAGFAGGSNS